jgi:alkyl hydroperoxide reductase subunit D
MSLKQFADTLPDYAKDLRLNLSSLLNDQTLGDQRKYGLLLACAHGTGYRPVVPEYGTLPAKLRMNAIATHGIEKDDFELFSLAVSAMNGCGMCIDSHERVLQQHGVKSETIQAAARIGAVVKAVATVHATL